MAVNVIGIASLGVFYLLILFIGIWASRKQKKNEAGSGTEDSMLAGRNVGIVLGMFSMTATWADGGYINGTAEIVFNRGVLWCQGTVGFSLSLVVDAGTGADVRRNSYQRQVTNESYSADTGFASVHLIGLLPMAVLPINEAGALSGGLFFAKTMRSRGYVTMLDPFQEAYGRHVGALMFIPALCGEIFWCAAILASLGATISVIVNLDSRISIIASGLIAFVYTVLGGMYSVTYTDVVELICVFVGLWLCVPFCLMNPAVKSLADTDWLGSVEPRLGGHYFDHCILVLLGGIPWQCYFQRVLSCRTARQAELLSYVAGFGCLFLALPAAVIGVVSKATAWNETAFAGNLTEESSTMILPLTLQYLTPMAVSFVGLGAISAAVMSSSDASFLSVASMVTRNIYKLGFRPKASEREIFWVMKIGILVAGALSTFMALTVNSINGLWFLSGDLVFVVLFPQLLCVVHLSKYSNTYGALTAYVFGVFLRASGGEPLLGIPVLIRFPFFDVDSNEQLFPFKTFIMGLSIVIILVVTALTNFLFRRGIISARFDVFRCVVRDPAVENAKVVKMTCNGRPVEVFTLSQPESPQAN